MARLPLRPLQGGQVAPQQVGLNPRAFGAGVAQALGLLGNTMEKRNEAEATLAQAYQATLEKQSLFNAQRQLQKFEADAAMFLTDAKTKVPGDGTGFTNFVSDEIDRRGNELMGGIEFASVRKQTEFQLNAVKNRLVLKAFNTEYATKTDYFKTELEDAVNRYRSDIFTGTKSIEEVEAQFMELMKSAPLPDVNKAAITLGARALFAEALYKKTVGEKELETPGFRSNAIFGALIQQESAGDPAAVGPPIPGRDERAQGIAQIMPSTAMSPGFGLKNIFELARNMGIEVGGETKEEAERLSKIKEVGLAFGKQYYDFLWKRYDGDVEAVLIGYNAGPAVADAWLKSGRDYASLPDRGQTEPYVKNILLKSDPSQIFKDPRFTEILFERKEVLAREAEAEATARRVAMEKAAKEQYDRYIEELKKHATFDPSFTKSQLDILLANDVIEHKDYTQLRGEIEKRLKVNEDYNYAKEKLEVGTLFNPGNTEDQAGLNAFAKETGLLGLIETRNSTAAVEVARVIDRAGMVPQNVTQLLVGMAERGRPEDAIFAFNLANQVLSVRDTGPVRLALGADFIASARMYETLSAVYPDDPNAVLARVRGQDISPNAELRKAAIKGVEEFFVEGFDISPMLNEMKGSWFDFTRDDTTTGTIQGNINFKHDVLAIYPIEFERAQGNVPAAMRATGARLAMLYSTSDIGGTRKYMKYGPEPFARMVNGTYDWMDAAIRDDLPIGALEFKLVPDLQTGADIKRLMGAQRLAAPRELTPEEIARGVPKPIALPGGPVPLTPSYQILVTGEDGTTRPLYRPDSQPLRYRFQETPEMVRDESLTLQARVLEDKIASVTSEAEPHPLSRRVSPGPPTKTERIALLKQELESNRTAQRQNRTTMSRRVAATFEFPGYPQGVTPPEPFVSGDVSGPSP